MVKFQLFFNLLLFFCSFKTRRNFVVCVYLYALSYRANGTTVQYRCVHDLTIGCRTTSKKIVYIIGTIAFGKGGEDLVGSCPRHLKGKNGNFEFSFDSSDNSLDSSEEEEDGGQKDEKEEVSFTNPRPNVNAGIRLVSTRSPSKNQEPKSTISQKLKLDFA